MALAGVGAGAISGAAHACDRHWPVAARARPSWYNDRRDGLLI